MNEDMIAQPVSCMHFFAVATMSGKLIETVLGRFNGNSMSFFIHPSQISAL